MVSGHSIPTHRDKQVDVCFTTIADSLQAHNLTWKNYAEGYPGTPGACWLASGKKKYARKHVPFLSFASVQQQGCGGVVNADQLVKDIQGGSLPEYSFFSPNLDDDGHDPVWNHRRGLAKAATWLSGFLEPLLKDPQFTRGTLVIITFDESKNHKPETNQIYTVFLGDMVLPGPVPPSYNHFNVLRTIEDNFGLPTLADGDGRAKPITEVWRAPNS
jgi:phospholipase C